MARPKRICSVPDCGKPCESHGLCYNHDRRLKLYGDPLAKSLRAPNGAPLAWLEANSLYDGDDCLKWPFASGDDGYGRLNYHGKSATAHRVMCILAHGDPLSGGLEAAHNCGNGHLGCCNPKHLRWATHLENEGDKRIHGTLPQGERQGRHRLSQDDVQQIRSMKGAMLDCDIAEQFDVHLSTISAIRRGKSWAWLPDTSE